MVLLVLVAEHGEGALPLERAAPGGAGLETGLLGPAGQLDLVERREDAAVGGALEVLDALDLAAVRGRGSGN